jgi:subtilase family serine protease
MPQLVRSPTRAKFNSITKRVEPAYTVYGPTTWGSGTGGYDVYFLPVAGDAAIMYNTPNNAMNTAYHGATWDGTGVSIGIAADSNLTAASQQDIVNYRVSFLNETAQQAAQHMPKIVVDGQDPGMNDDALEAILDIELAQALAPGVTTIMYTSDNTELQNGVFLALQRAVDDNAVNILNLSFQECEQYLGASGNAFLNELYEQAAAQGITVVVAAGDSGSAACDGGTFSMSSKGTAAGLGVNGLASTPWNVAVGGTDFDAMFGNPSQYVQVPLLPGQLRERRRIFPRRSDTSPRSPGMTQLRYSTGTRTMWRTTSVAAPQTPTPQEAAVAVMQCVRALSRQLTGHARAR